MRKRLRSLVYRLPFVTPPKPPTLGSRVRDTLLDLLVLWP
jgi:hypothetical protein